MMGDVVDLDVETTVPIPADKVLEAAKGELDSVLLIGYGSAPDGNGLLEMRIGGDLTRSELLYMLEAAKLRIMGVLREG